MAVLQCNDLILYQITSQLATDQWAVSIDNNDFISGSLKQISNVSPNRIFTADKKIISYRIGQLEPEKFNAVIAQIVKILQE